MIVGVPKEIKNHEYRVGLTPSSVIELIISFADNSADSFMLAFAISAINCSFGMGFIN